MSGDSEAWIIRCPSCRQLNRIRNRPLGRIAICGKCSTPLEDVKTNSVRARKSPPRKSYILTNVLLAIALVIISLGIVTTPKFIKKDYSELSLEESKKTETARREKEEDLRMRKANLERELKEIDPVKLRRKAAQQYNRELEGRKSYDKRFALSPREKSQLRMLNLASDSTKTFHDAIRTVAREAAPKGSDIRVEESVRGIELHIDFDMSSVTSGEYGTRTKHDTVDSLRKEVISLMSRVSNDIFQFCRNLDLTTIHVGCRHYVKMEDSFGASKDENTVLYKILIKKNRIFELTSNPFLDLYSASNYFEVEEDNFEGIEIIKTVI